MDKDKEEIQESFIYSSFKWQPIKNLKTGHIDLDGPLCPVCSVELPPSSTLVDGELIPEARCWNCDKSFAGNQFPVQEMRRKAYKIYRAGKRSLYPVINFDIPPTALTNSSTEDDNFFVGYKFGQDKGRKQLHIWVGEKKKEQGNKDKTQLIIDIDKEELRHDQTNKFPGEIIADAKVVFKKSSTGVKYD